MPHRTAALLAIVAATRAVAAGLPGDLDPTFNGGQPLVLDLARTVPRVSFVNGVTRDPAGGFVLCGSASDENGNPGVALFRVNDAGIVDPAFADGGAQVLQLGLGAAPGSNCRDVEPGPAGRWLLGGEASAADGRTAGLVASFGADGMLDLAFGSGGSIRPQVAGAPPALWYTNGSGVTPDGSMLLAGTLEPDPNTGGDTRLVVAKITPEGNVATGFGNQPTVGALVQSFSETAESTSGGFDVLATPAGLLVVGTTLDSLARFQFLLARLLPSGTVDSSFAGGAGFVRAQVADPAATTRDSQAYDVAVGPDGEIYVGGEASDSDERLAMAITRFTPGGMLDATFGIGGTRRIQLGSGNEARTTPAEVLVQPDGKVVVVGRTSSGIGGDPSTIVVLRLDTQGDLDPVFGSGGIAMVDLGASARPGGAALSADARSVVVGGATASDGEVRVLVTRVLLEPLEMPPGGCEASASLAGARCRLGLLATALETAVPSAKLAGRLGRTLARAGDQLAMAEGLSGRALQKKLRKARVRLARLRKQLNTKAARRDIGADRRAALIADADALVAELDAIGD